MPKSDDHKLRWLIVTTNYAPELTGIGKINGEMAEWLVDHGHEVEVITAPPHYPEWQVADGFTARRWTRRVERGVTVHRVPVRLPRTARPSTKDRLAFELSYMLSSMPVWLRLLFRRRKPDVIFCTCPPTQTGVPAYVYSRLRRVPWIYHVQDLQIDAARDLGMLRDSRALRLLARIELFLLRHATFASTISEQMRQRIVDKGVEPDHVRVHPNWANLDHIAPAPADPEMRRSLGAGPDDFLVAHSGNVGEKQGLELMLDVAESLSEEPRIRFAIVGDGAAKQRLVDEARARGLDAVRFAPLQPFERLPDVLRAADLHLILQRPDAADLVMPSRLANVLAAGRPVLATAAPGTALHDAVVSASAGSCVPPDDVSAIAREVRRLSIAGGDARSAGARGRSWAEQHLEQGSVLKRLVRAATALLEGD